jgi:ribosome-associated protein
MTFSPHYLFGRRGDLLKEKEGNMKHALHIDDSEVELSAIRAQGPGGQNVNKVSSAIQLRFDVAGSTLPDDVKQRWLESGDSRLTLEGVFILKAQKHRTQEANRVDAWARLYETLDLYAKPPKPRKATKPTYGSVQRRLEGKSIQSKIKASRRGQD